jgi:hypothetical protein
VHFTIKKANANNQPKVIKNSINWIEKRNKFKHLNLLLTSLTYFKPAKRQ